MMELPRERRVKWQPSLDFRPAFVEREKTVSGVAKPFCNLTLVRGPYFSKVNNRFPPPMALFEEIAIETVIFTMSPYRLID